MPELAVSFTDRERVLLEELAWERGETVAETLEWLVRMGLSDFSPDDAYEQTGNVVPFPIQRMAE
jgi:hypothetical protein